MTAESIMSGDLVTVTSDLTVADALYEMVQHKVHNIPVVDKQGSFVGLFSLRRLAHEMLPAAARLNEDNFQINIGFLQDESDEFFKRLQKLGKKPVAELLEKKKKLRFCELSTPIPRLLQLLSENPTSLPVVILEGKKKRVVGMVSTWDVLMKISATILSTEGPDKEGETSIPTEEG